jgi:hypothetical protein
MSLDIYFYQVQETCVHAQNITHNLNSIADEAGFYKALWRPEENGITTTSELLPFLESGVKAMREDPERFKKLSAANGWGTYEQFLPWLDELIAKCKEFPNATIRASR